MRLVLTLAIIAAAAAPAALQAQDCVRDKTCAAAPVDPAHQRVEQANAEMAAAAEAALAAEQRREAAAWADRQARIDGEQQAYQDRLAATQAEADRRVREHEAAMADWRRRVAACQAGVVSQCATPN